MFYSEHRRKPHVIARSEATWQSPSTFRNLGGDCHDQSADWSRNDTFYRNIFRGVVGAAPYEGEI